jgi:hypothetical protein
LRRFADADGHGDGNAHSYAHAYSDSGETVANAEAASIITAAASLVGKQLIATA